MNKIIACWGIPRSRSTAFRWMMQNRGDFETLHEPFCKSAYFSEDRFFNRYMHYEPESQYNYKAVLQNLLTIAKEKAIWMKDFAHYVMPIVDTQFLSYFQHSFLIRHPEQMLPSIFHGWPDVTKEELGYKELYDLFESVCDFMGEIPPIIDADDLVQAPIATVEAYCHALRIPFISTALNWEKPKTTQHLSTWNDGGSWQKNLSNSTGFKKQKNHAYKKIEEDERLQELYEYCIPFYEKLYAHRLRCTLTSK